MTRGARGSALVLAMLILTIAQALLLAVTTRAILSAQGARAAVNDAHALNAAEAGLADAVQRLLADNTASNGEGRVGLAAWEVEGEEELRAPSLSVATFKVSATCRDRSCRMRLRVVVKRDEYLMIAELSRLDWERLP